MRNFNKTKLLYLCGNVLPIILLLQLSFPDFSILSSKGNSLSNVNGLTLYSSIDEFLSFQDNYLEDGDDHFLEFSDRWVIEITSSKLRYFLLNSELRADIISLYSHSRSPPVI